MWENKIKNVGRNSVFLKPKKGVYILNIITGKVIGLDFSKLT
jgi:hypothetical protein